MRQTRQKRQGARAGSGTPFKVKVISWVTVVLLAALCLVPLALTNTKREYRSSVDNRTLAELPDKFDAQGYEGYLLDRIGLRSQMMYAYAYLHDRFLHVMKHPLYEYGKDGYAFRQFWGVGEDLAYIDDFAASVRSLADYCQNRGIPFLYVITPEKTRVYPEYIPDTVTPPDQGEKTLKRYLDHYGVRYIDQADALIRAKDQGIQVYNRVYDSGHWNDEGAFVGTQAVIEALQHLGVNVDALDKDDYELTSLNVTSLNTGNYPIDDWIPQLTYKGAGGAVNHEGWASALMTDSQYHDNHWYTCEKSADKPRLLMFQGSYYNVYGKGLQNQFSQTLQIHAYHNLQRFAYYVNVFKPDVVVFESADYTINEEYYPTASKVFSKLPVKRVSAYSDLPVEGEWDEEASVRREAGLVTIDVRLPLAGDPLAYLLTENETMDGYVDRYKHGVWTVPEKRLEGVRTATVELVYPASQTRCLIHVDLSDL